MDNLILICIMILIAGIGSYIVKFLDAFQRKTGENSPGLRIAYEHPEDCLALQYIYEKIFSYPSCKEMKIFYGSEEQIRNSMKEGMIDLAVLESDDRIKKDDYTFSQTICMWTETFEYQDINIPVRPLLSKKVERIMVWEKNDNPDLNRWIQFAIASEKNNFTLWKKTGIIP